MALRTYWIGGHLLQWINAARYRAGNSFVIVQGVPSNSFHLVGQPCQATGRFHESYIRAYWGEEGILYGLWKLPVIKKVK